MSCVVFGNSHMIALRDAIEAGGVDPLDARCFYPIYTDFNVVHIPGPGGDRAKVRASPPWNGDDGGVFLEEFDNVIISAGGWPAARNSTVADNGGPSHPLAHMACADWGYDPARVPDRVRLTSVAVFTAAVEAWVRDRPLVRLVQRIGALSGKRILLQPCPPPGGALQTDEMWCLNRWYGAFGTSAWRDFFRAQFLALEAVAAGLGSHVTVLDYPSRDMFEEGFIDESLCGPDQFHANAIYGALVVQQLAGLLNDAEADDA